MDDSQELLRLDTGPAFELIEASHRCTGPRCTDACAGSPGGAIETSWLRPATSYVIQHGNATLVLDDVTTLHFEGEHKDELLARQTGRRHSGAPESCHVFCRSRFWGSSRLRVW